MEVVTRGGGVLRLEGAWDADPNGGLLCQKGRFDPLYEERERVTHPLVRHNGVLERTDWDTALAAAAQRLESTACERLGVLTTSNATSEALFVLREALVGRLGARHVGLLNGTTPALLSPEGKLADLDEADLVVVVGADPAAHQPVASFLIKRAVDRGAHLVVVDCEDSGLAPFADRCFASSEVAQAVEMAARAGHPVVVYGTRLSVEAAGALQKLERACFVALEPGVNTRAAVALGLAGRIDAAEVDTAFVLLGEQDWEDGTGLPEIGLATYAIVQASYVSSLTERADVVLPMAVWSERSGSFANLEGRVLQASQAQACREEARADWEILVQLAGKLGACVPNALEDLCRLAGEELAR
jgi:predicted molibdopterin-dependent oxidoreductase YjgC